MNFVRSGFSVLAHSFTRHSNSTLAKVVVVTGSKNKTYHFADNKQSLSSIGSIRYFSKSTTSAMKFVQFKTGSDTEQRLGVLSADGSSISDISDSFSGDLISLIKSGASLDSIQQRVAQASKIPLTNVNLLAPVTNPQKILCVGLNYSGHCEEQNKPIPKEPMFFSKYASTIVGPFDGVVAHKITNQIDWEVELAVIIGKKAKHVTKADAMDYVFGYTVAQDISARDWQKTRNGGQFLIGKSMDTFCPLGPAVVHKSLVKDPHNLVIKCSVNGVEKQKGNTSELVFRIDDIIERVTQSITLLPGDVILTGTPAGVGMHRNPPEFLQPGDVIDSEIELIGKIKNNVVTG
ncbi:fumarylacetoacetate hydrolase domain-containing protein 2A-like [Topomyia yanbarensis]|uniref:fumarylacetoacetate hydrolase domain-containing protein 2A-like n=1 Tax=Topomyia yanbarensis TaxID=2498891 RepID=UPI00273C7D94|nr:fumarylacetoacetate hydrolase domain-containing protein 2A-like [Topomyia yanbarensis]XP_058829485.1 fumarylacetoacetate hydrolase domain-containing protein 2A-like [Topomyia yanbarensis]XP_058829486.1 fumarylacetoacetate hydrolase domain-containing protein 2A-like [Topomyia yanbarensis]XP_058829487.1 fumarylacetoacetate hydrolase domain-containing protein 2A-like [Topomyia yanbarensis]